MCFFDLGNSLSLGGGYALGIYKAIFRARTYSRITGGDDYLIDE